MEGSDTRNRLNAPKQLNLQPASLRALASPGSPRRNTFVARLTQVALCATCCTLGGVPVRVAGALSAGCGMMRSVTGRLMLLDTASLYFRAYFGVPESVRAPDGTPVNAVRGLLDFIDRLVRDHRPDH